MKVVAAILEKDDIIYRGGVLHKVVHVSCTHINTVALSTIGRKKNFYYGGSAQIGIKSKEKIILIKDVDGIDVSNWGNKKYCPIGNQLHS